MSGKRIRKLQRTPMMERMRAGFLAQALPAHRAQESVKYSVERAVMVAAPTWPSHGPIHGAMPAVREIRPATASSPASRGTSEGWVSFGIWTIPEGYSLYRIWNLNIWCTRSDLCFGVCCSVMRLDHLGIRLRLRPRLSSCPTCARGRSCQVCSCSRAVAVLRLACLAFPRVSWRPPCTSSPVLGSAFLHRSFCVARWLESMSRPAPGP